MADTKGDIDFTDPDNHFVTHVEHLDTKIIVGCLCGARWSEPVKATAIEIANTMKAHRNYYNKPKTVTL